MAKSIDQIQKVNYGKIDFDSCFLETQELTMRNFCGFPNFNKG